MTLEKVKEFRKLGLIQEVNRQFLHPLGLALAITIDGTDCTVDILDERDDPEGFLFTDHLISKEKIDTFRYFVDERHKLRQKKLGFVIQEPD